MGNNNGTPTGSDVGAGSQQPDGSPAGQTLWLACPFCSVYLDPHVNKCSTCDSDVSGFLDDMLGGTALRGGGGGGPDAGNAGGSNLASIYAFPDVVPGQAPGTVFVDDFDNPFPHLDGGSGSEPSPVPVPTTPLAASIRTSFRRSLVPCPFCGMDNAGDNDECVYCAKPLPTLAETPAGQPESARHCPSCLHLMPVAAAKCPLCDFVDVRAFEPSASLTPTGDDGGESGSGHPAPPHIDIPERPPAYDTLFSPYADPTAWNCLLCKFTNRGGAQVCAACENPRQFAPSSTTASAAEARAAIEAQTPGRNASLLPLVSPASQNVEDQLIALIQSGMSLSDDANLWSMSQNLSSIKNDQLSQARESADAILAACLSDGSRFFDEAFPPNDHSLYGDIVTILPNDPERESLVWLRPSDLPEPSGNGWSLVGDGGVTPDSIRQGALGDCWFLSALCVLAERPEIINDILLTTEINEAGIYQVRFCKAGAWEIVTVDDWLPVLGDGSFAYARSRQGELWVPLIEKAYAKLFGSYDAIVAGTMDHALTHLTGAPCEQLDIFNVNGMGGETMSLEDVWIQLVSWHEAGYLMGASCGTNEIPEAQYEAVGLYGSHAYSVLQVFQQGETMLIKIRNPWGGGSREWNGDYSDDSPLWTDDLREAVGGVVSANDGVFWMSFSDFVLYFRRVDVCKIQRDWSEIRYRDSLERPHIYRITVVKPTWMFLSVYQNEIRGGDRIKNYHDLGLVVAEATQVPRSQDVMLMASSYRSSLVRDVLLDVNRDGTPRTFLVMPFAIGFPDENFVLCIHSARPVAVSKEAFDKTRLAWYCQMGVAVRGGRAPAKASAREISPGVTMLTMSQGPAIWICLENRSNTYCMIELDCSGSEGMTSSRGTHVTRDIIPADSRQILMVLTAKNVYTGWTWRMSFNYSVGNMEETHEPWTDVKDLHAVVPILG